MRFSLLSGLLFVASCVRAQTSPPISESDVFRIEKILSSDDMKGRQIFTTGIEKAADFITKEFREAGLKPLPGQKDYRQTFEMADTESPDVVITPDGKTKMLTNLVGMIPGISKPDEYVIFSAHYDHLGTGKPDAKGDSIFNGANDDASGVTAVILLAKYFNQIHNNQRTLIFVAFTAEEIGDFGSAYFSKKLDPEKVVAMLNIEMIGTKSKWGENSAYITGYEMTDLGSILEKNLKKTQFRFYPDPYPEEQLFLRSDNASLAEMGVPAHTISTSKMDSEKYYHTRGDTIETLDLENMTEIIRAIGLSAGSIIAGTDTPRRLGL